MWKEDEEKRAGQKTPEARRSTDSPASELSSSTSGDSSKSSSGKSKTSGKTEKGPASLA